MGALDSVLFCVWGFPEPTQTFIHREFIEMELAGERIQVLASHRVAGPVESPQLQAIADRAVYFGPGWRWMLGGIFFGIRHPVKMSSVLGWVLTQPHRTFWHRVRGLGLVFAAASVSELVRRAGYRYLHAHFAHHAELVMALARLNDLPWGATFHAVGIWRERNLLKQKVESAELIMTCTECNRHELLRHAPNASSTVHLVYHGLEAEVFSREGAAPSGCKRYLTVGRLVEKKGLHVLLQAWAMLPSPRPHLDIVGDGPWRTRLEDQARALDLGDSVGFLGRRPNHEVLDLMSRCRALIQPSLQGSNGDVDGIPNVIIEAMALRRPVIASAISGIPEVVLNEETGILVEARDEAALFRAILKLESSDEGLDEMGAAGRRLVQAHFDVRSNVAKQLALLEEARLGRKRAAR